MFLLNVKVKLFPNGANLPNYYYEAKKIVKVFHMIRLMLVLVIACYTERRIAYTILESFMVS